jgi:chaperone modulatory protein CbpM
MNVERIDAAWLAEHQLVSIEELTDRWGVSSSQLHELIAHGVLEPTAATPVAGFRLESVSLVRTACRLQQELELDTHAVGVVLELLKRLRALESEVDALRARLGAAGEEGGDAPEAEVVRPARP